MRELATIVLASHLGEVLTPERAKEILSHFPREGRPIDLAQFQPKTCGSLVFAVERGANILPELEVLHKAHWTETEAYHRGIPMNPDIAACIVDEQCGRLMQFTARHQGALVGNIRMYVNQRSRHTQAPIAHEDTVYLLPEWRGGRFALRFLQYMEACVAQLHDEDTEVYMDDKVANPSAARLLEFLEYEHIANRRYKILRGKRHVLGNA